MEIHLTSPVDDSTLLERSTATEEEVKTMLERAKKAQLSWQEIPLPERSELLEKFIQAFLAERDEAAEELTWQMGRPICQTPRELDEFERRSKVVLKFAPERLDRVNSRQDESVHRFQRQVPVGTVLVRAGWNYPYIVAAHTVIPALIAGNSVLLQHSVQTPLCSERLERAFRSAGGPEGLLQAIHLDRATSDHLSHHPQIGQVAVTGVVPRERPVVTRRAPRHIGVGLELGGKDSAYVRHDADLERAVSGLVEGTFYNSGQSCCGVERIYIHRSLYKEFLERFEAQTRALVFGNPTEPATTLGPMVRFQAAVAMFEQVDKTIRQGATHLLPHNPPERAYFGPQILVDVEPGMQLMREETFGPAVGLMAVDSDEQALELMNDSRYALASGIWTTDVEAGTGLAHQLKTSSVFVNRCDYLEPAIGWLGQNDTGHGFTLSRIGYRMVTTTKCYDIRS